MFVHYFTQLFFEMFISQCHTKLFIFSLYYQLNFIWHLFASCPFNISKQTMKVNTFFEVFFWHSALSCFDALLIYNDVMISKFFWLFLRVIYFFVFPYTFDSNILPFQVQKLALFSLLYLLNWSILLLIYNLFLENNSLNSYDNDILPCLVL